MQHKRKIEEFDKSHQSLTNWHWRTASLNESQDGRMVFGFNGCLLCSSFDKNNSSNPQRYGIDKTNGWRTKSWPRMIWYAYIPSSLLYIIIITRLQNKGNRLRLSWDLSNYGESRKDPEGESQENSQELNGIEQSNNHRAHDKLKPTIYESKHRLDLHSILVRQRT